MEALVLDDENGCLRVVMHPNELANLACGRKENGAPVVAYLSVILGLPHRGGAPLTELLMDILRALEQDHAPELAVGLKPLKAGLRTGEGAPLGFLAEGATKR